MVSMTQRGIFDEGNRLVLLNAMEDHLAILERTIKRENIRSLIGQKIRRPRNPKGGRSPFNVVLTSKTLVLQRLYYLSDDQTKFQINDRTTYMRFLNPRLNDEVADTKKIWEFQNELTSCARALFKLFNEQRYAERLITLKGSPVGSALVEAPRQRIAPRENEHIKKDQTPTQWEKEYQKYRIAQKDQDVRRAQKGGERHFAYKNHIKTESDSELITSYMWSDASAHDRGCCVSLLDSEDRVLYENSAYPGKDISKPILPVCKGRILEKGAIGNTVTKKHKYKYRQKSCVPFQTDHVFGFMTKTMKRIILSCIGIVRVKFKTSLISLIYNMWRSRLSKKRMWKTMSITVDCRYNISTSDLLNGLLSSFLDQASANTDCLYG